MYKLKLSNIIKLSFNLIYLVLYPKYLKVSKAIQSCPVSIWRMSYYSLMAAVSARPGGGGAGSAPRRL